MFQRPLWLTENVIRIVHLLNTLVASRVSMGLLFVSSLVAIFIYVEAYCYFLCYEARER